MCLRAIPLLLATLACAACNKRDPPTPSVTATATAKPLADAPVSPRDPEDSQELVAFPSGALTLHGFLYRPRGDGPFPAVVFNHGSERLPGDKRGQAMFYASHGFVLFVPHRRGQGQSGDVAEYIVDHASDHARTVDELATTQTDDVMSAVEYVRSLPYVDRTRVAVAGCSFGGIVSLFAAERGTGIQAVVDFAGGAMSWAYMPELQERMKQAARAAKVPVFFVQAENDFNTAPSLVLSEEMRRAGKPMRVHVFPANGVTHEEGHGFCAGGENPGWGDEVLEFLKTAPSGAR
jgi:carboxymethylenebutenolidase